jgi:hypothetical protein
VLCREGSPVRLDLYSLAAAFTGMVGYAMVALPFTRDGAVHREAVEALEHFIAEHAEEALGEIRRSEPFIASVRPDLAVPQQDAMRSTGEFLLAARRWLDEACGSGETVWRRDGDPRVEAVLSDEVVSAR